MFERLLLEGAFDCYNSSFSPGGDQAVVTYRDGDCSGQRRVAIYNLNTGASRELPTIASNVWPSSSGALFISWSPYDGLLVLESKLFCSPVDGQVAGTWSAPAGYDVLGFDKDWRWHATDRSLVHILQLLKNP